MLNLSEQRFSTKAIHAHQHPEPGTGAVTPPIYQTSTYAQAELGEEVKYDYGRTINPTRERLEANLATLEHGKFGFSFASGMSAIAAATSMLHPGDHVIASDDMYGGTYRYFSRILQPMGIEFSFVDMRDANSIESAVRPATKLVYAETPSNPMMSIIDLEALGKFSHRHRLTSVVDNTFASPYCQNPLLFGVDIVLHSVTKYIGGHSDVIGGAVITSNDDLAAQFRFYQNSYGAIQAPFDCWLLLRSVKTLAIRMKTHSQNAQAVAERLVHDPRVHGVHYPGLTSHPQYSLAKKQMGAFGGMISIDIGSLVAARKFTSALEIFTLGESLGGVESLVCHPLTMTHASVPSAQRERLGITPGLIRLSVGIEDEADLIRDIENGLQAI